MIYTRLCVTPHGGVFFWERGGVLSFEAWHGIVQRACADANALRWRLALCRLPAHSIYLVFVHLKKEAPVIHVYMFYRRVVSCHQGE